MLLIGFRPHTNRVMNYYFITAGIFLFVCLLIHMIAGDRDYRTLDPRKTDPASSAEKTARRLGVWLMGRGTFQMVSVDLLVSSAFVFLTGINAIPFSYHLMLFVALLYGGYLVFWLLTLLVSKAGASNYINQGQWILFLVAVVLITLGIRGAA